eukprot:gene2897-4740_t
MSIAADWIKVGGTGNQSYYQKKEVYDIDWNILEFDFDNYVVGVASNGGPVALSQDPMKALLVNSLEESLPFIYIYSSSGRLISKFMFNKGSVHSLGWTSDEDLVVLTCEAQVFLYDFYGNLKHQISFVEKVKDSGILYSVLWECGLAIMSNDLEVWVISDFDDSYCEMLQNVKFPDIPNGIEVLLNYDEDDMFLIPEILIAPKEGSLVLNGMDGYRDLKVNNGPFLSLSLSPSRKLIALFSESGMLFIYDSDLTQIVTEFNTRSKAAPSQFIWCGDDSICLYWTPQQLNKNDKSLVLMISPIGYNKFTFDGSIYLSSEIDGIRIFTSDTCEFLQKVPNSIKDIFSIGSLEPSAQLFDCFTEYEETSSIQMKYIESLRRDLNESIIGCLNGACSEFDLRIQRKLLGAASYGKSFLRKFNSQLFVEKCQIIRVLNAMRDEKVGIPITYEQYKNLTIQKLIKRLLIRNLHFLAFKICNYLNIQPSMVVEHWSMEKIKRSENDDETLKLVVDKMKMSPNASFSKLATIAFESGNKNLALGFLEYEISAGEQVPVLMKMKEMKRALLKSIESGETDLIYLVLLEIKEKVEPKILFKIISEPYFELPKQLLITYCKEQDTEFLKQFFQSSDLPEEAALMFIQETFNHKNDNSARIKRLKVAKDLFSTKKECYVDSKLIQEEIDLINIQEDFDSLSSDAIYSNTSISDSIYNAILERQDKKALALKSKFSVPDKRYWWLRVKALSKCEYWDELESFAKSKKSPIGYSPFVQVCLDRNNLVEASKYVTKVSDPREKVDFCILLGMWKEAIDAAAKDQKLLVTIANKTKDPQIRGTIQTLLKKF